MCCFMWILGMRERFVYKRGEGDGVVLWCWKVSWCELKDEGEMED